MLEDGDTILDLVGVGLVLAVLVGVGVVAVAIGAGPTETGAPDANWSVERVNGSFVAITLAGGDPVEPEKLFVTVDTLQRSADWPPLVTEGNGTVVRAGENAVVRLYWDGGRAQKTVLAKWQV
jgi:hypothetical protein